MTAKRASKKGGTTATRSKSNSEERNWQSNPPQHATY
jgi:hypothetical protein